MATRKSKPPTNQPTGKLPPASMTPLTEAQLDALFEEAKRELRDDRQGTTKASDPISHALSGEIKALKRIFDKKR